MSEPSTTSEQEIPVQSLADPVVRTCTERVLAALLVQSPSRRDLVVRAVVRAAPDLTVTRQKTLINQILDTGLVTRTGRARGTRYAVTSAGKDYARTHGIEPEEPTAQPTTPANAPERKDAASADSTPAAAPPADPPVTVALASRQTIPLRVESGGRETPADPVLEAKRRERLAELQAYRAHLTVQLEATNGAIDALREAM